MSLAKILIVDDEQDTRQYIQTILKHQDYTLITADSGEDALIMLETEPDIDVMLLDIMMPGLDGFEVLEIIKATPKTAAIKVIMLSAMNRIDDKIKAFSAGASDYVVKPFDRGELIARINTQVQLKLAELALWENKERYRNLFENSPTAMWEYNWSKIKSYLDRLKQEGITDFTAYFNQYPDEAGYCASLAEPLDVNNAALKLYKADSKTTLLQDLNQIFNPKSYQFFQLELIAIAAGQTCLEIEGVNQTLTGQTLNVRIKWVVMPGYEHSLGKVLVSILDVTEHKKSEERYRTLAENANDLIARLTPHGDYTYVSPAAYTILGYQPDEMLGHSFYSFIHPEDRAEIEAMAPPLLDTTSNAIITVRFLRKDNVYVWMEISIHGVRQPATDTTESVAVARDVTERKRYEAALRHARDELEQRVAERTDELSASNELLKMEIEERQRVEAALQKERATLARRVEERTAELSAANAELSRAARLKDEFLASMSHELRTPLNAVLGMSEALQEEIYGPLNEKQKKALTSVEESGRHLLALINDILDLSKVEAGKLHLEIGPVPVEEVCQASLRFIRQEALKKRIRISSSFDGSVTTIMADMRRLKQILVNLLSNAVKFTPEGGKIGLEVEGDDAQNAIHFTVWDTGIGIPREKMSNLFQSFVQLDSKLSRRYSGTGLGLALVRRMTEIHGGSVSLESEEGQGSRFTVSMPWKSDISASKQVSPEVTSTAETLSDFKQALIIEDSAITAEQLVRYLGELNIKAAVHPQGNQAIRKTQEIAPDIILLDILLPDRPGWEILAELKKEPQTKHLPVIIISVLEEKESALSLGANAYLTKPVSRQQLQQTLASLSGGSQTDTANGQPSAINTAPLILLAEDNEANINTLSDYLLNKGYRLIVARNGLEAINRTRDENPHLILMDIQMPEMDGLTAIRHIRADSGHRHTPIIALTALAMPGDKERCLEAGANDYMSKPVSLKGLIQAIEMQLKEMQVVTYEPS